MIFVCPNCGAKCTEANQINRFKRRHPAVCRRVEENKKFNEELAKGTRSIPSEFSLVIEDGKFKSKEK